MPAEALEVIFFPSTDFKSLSADDAAVSEMEKIPFFFVGKQAREGKTKNSIKFLITGVSRLTLPVEGASGWHHRRNWGDAECRLTATHYGGRKYCVQYENMSQSLRTPFLLQSLRTSMLFDGWLIDWINVACTFFHFSVGYHLRFRSSLLFYTKDEYYAHRWAGVGRVWSVCFREVSIFKVRKLWGIPSYSINQSTIE